jgi:hypothetical protein
MKNERMTVMIENIRILPGRASGCPASPRDEYKMKN